MFRVMICIVGRSKPTSAAYDINTNTIAACTYPQGADLYVYIWYFVTLMHLDNIWQQHFQMYILEWKLSYYA